MVADQTRKAIDGLGLYEAKTLKPVKPPLFNTPVAFVLLDHDKTMTNWLDPQNRMASLFLHMGAVEALEEALLAGKGFGVSSTVNVFRLMRQYSRSIHSSLAKARLILSGEVGAVFAIPLDLTCSHYAVLLKPSSSFDLLQLRQSLNRAVDRYRRDRGVDVFLNQDLLANITIENFSRNKQATSDLADLAREVIKDVGAEPSFTISQSTYSIEVMRRDVQKDSVVAMFKELLPDGIMVSIGDGASDIPAFQNSYGIQIPSQHTQLHEIKPLPGAQLIAVGPNAAGATTELVIRELLAYEPLLTVDYQELQLGLLSRLKSRGYVKIREVCPTSIRSDYSLPESLRGKYELLFAELERHLTKDFE